jgi:hypothetical protein
MQACGIPAKNGIVLAHARKNALRACGFGCDEDAGNSNTAAIARAVGTFWSFSVAGRARESILRSIERLILELMGQIDDGEVPSHAAERRGLDTRWLRRSALELVSRVPRTCGKTRVDRSAWLSSLRGEVLRLGLTLAPGISVPRYFPDRANADWQGLLVTGAAPEPRSATIHEAKGTEYDVVCVVIPPDLRPPRRTEELFTTWQNRADDEAKRVIYVGITRAKILGVFAIPVLHDDRTGAILTDAHVNFLVHAL